MPSTARSKVAAILAWTLLISGAIGLSEIEISLRRRLQANTTPKINYTVSSAGFPNITFANFQAVPRSPDTVSQISSFPVSLNGSVFNIPLVLGSNAKGGVNTGQLLVPWNTREIQLGFDDTCLLPIAVLTANSSLFTYQLTSDLQGLTHNLQILSGQVIGRLGAINSTVTSVDYSNQATVNARANNLTTMGLKFPGGAFGNSSALFIYCPLRAQEFGVVTFVANISTTNLTPSTNGTHNATTSDPNNVALIIALTIGLGFPLLMFTLLFFWWFFFRRGKIFQREPVQTGYPPYGSQRAQEDLQVADKNRQAEDQRIVITAENEARMIGPGGADRVQDLPEIRETRFE
jgi:hypothetical protein